MGRWADQETTMEGIAVQPNEITEVLNRPISQKLLARDLTRLAYVAKDGTPRNVPIGFTWNGSEIVMCTTKNAPKLPALRKNPTVALTIDTEVHPPKILLIRGRAELDVVDGIPDEYLEASGTYKMTPEQRVEWEREVRSAVATQRSPAALSKLLTPVGLNRNYQAFVDGLGFRDNVPRRYG